MPYRPAPMDQPNSLTCVDTSTAMLVDRITVGRIRPHPLTIRRATGVSGRGLSYGEAAYAVSKLYGITLAPRYALSRDQIHDLGSADRPFVDSLHTGVTRYIDEINTGTFIGGHSVYCNEYDYRGGSEPCRCHLRTSIDHGEWAIEDPGTYTDGWRYWPSGVFYRAGEYRTGGNGINVLVGRDTEGVTRRCISEGNIWSQATTTSTKRGRLVVGRDYYVSSTVNGGTWKRANGTTANGWHKIRLSTGGAGYVTGKRLK